MCADSAARTSAKARLSLLIEGDHTLEAMVRDHGRAGRLPVDAPDNAAGLGIRRPVAQPTARGEHQPAERRRPREAWEVT